MGVFNGLVSSAAAAAAACHLPRCHIAFRGETTKAHMCIRELRARCRINFPHMLAASSRFSFSPSLPLSRAADAVVPPPSAVAPLRTNRVNADFLSAVNPHHDDYMRPKASRLRFGCCRMFQRRSRHDIRRPLLSSHRPPHARVVHV